MNYDQIAETIRKHSHEELTLPEGMVQYVYEHMNMGDQSMPRHALADACRAYSQGDKYMTANQGLFYSDLFTLGVEHVLAQLPTTTESFGLEFLGLYEDRMGYEFYRDYPQGMTIEQIEKSDTPENYIAKLEAKSETLVRFDCQQSYIVRAHGMGEVHLDLLADWPGRKLYACNICEGEGWWATLFFAVEA